MKTCCRFRPDDVGHLLNHERRVHSEAEPTHETLRIRVREIHHSKPNLNMHFTLLGISYRSDCSMVRLLAGLLAFAIVLPAAAETKSKTKKAPVGSAATKKKAIPPKKTEPKDAPATSPSENAGKPEAEPEGTPSRKSAAAPNASIAPEEILEYRAQPAGVRKLIDSSLELARQNLTYTYGSADPAKGGMDCSGFIYYVLRQHGLTQVPRDSSGLYTWVRKARGFRAVISRKPDSFELDELLPGDLLFWNGTYAIDRDPPVTHTMIYLGTEKATGAKVMVGSSDGRSYRGQKRNGVSVFDFTMPRTPATGEQHSTFIGYARIPGLRD